MIPVLKLYLKKDPWYITTDIPEENLIVFIEDDNGKIKHVSIPMKDILDWDLEYEAIEQGGNHAK